MKQSEKAHVARARRNKHRENSPRIIHFPFTFQRVGTATSREDEAVSIVGQRTLKGDIKVPLMVVTFIALRNRPRVAQFSFPPTRAATVSLAIFHASFESLTLPPSVHPRISSTRRAANVDRIFKRGKIRGSRDARRHENRSESLSAMSRTNSMFPERNNGTFGGRFSKALHHRSAQVPFAANDSR